MQIGRFAARVAALGVLSLASLAAAAQAAWPARTVITTAGVTAE